MRILALALCIVLATDFVASAGPEPIRDFKTLVETLVRGEEVRAVIHYGRCLLFVGGKAKRAPDAIGGMSVDTFEYFARGSVRNEKAFLVFSESKLINYKGYIYNYAKVKVFEDGAVEVTAQYADPKDFKVVMDETFRTRIHDGRRGALYLYAD